MSSLIDEAKLETEIPSLSLSVSIDTDSNESDIHGPITSTYRVGANFEICVKRVTNENAPFNSFELYLTGNGVCKLLLKSTKLNYNEEFVYNLSDVNPKKIHWITEKSDRVNLLKIKIPKREELSRLEVLRRRRLKRDEKKKRNEVGKLRRLPAGETQAMDSEDALCECVLLLVLRDVSDM